MADHSRGAEPLSCLEVQRPAELGLKRGFVHLVPHSTTWPKLFQQEKARLRNLIGTHTSDIQHVGSTSVPGLVAKPVLDIAVTVADLEVVDWIIRPMESLGYVYFGDQKGRGDHFFAKGCDEFETCFVHVVRFDDPAWGMFLRFRDYLARSDNARVRYMKEKLRLAQLYPDNRRAYTEGKAKVIGELLEEAQVLLVTHRGYVATSDAVRAEH